MRTSTALLVLCSDEATKPAKAKPVMRPCEDCKKDTPQIRKGNIWSCSNCGRDVVA